MDCRVCVAAGDLLVRLGAGVGQIGGFSHESEHDLALMVSDFLENGSVGAESWCSSDSDSGFSDLPFLAEKISVFFSTHLRKFILPALCFPHDRAKGKEMKF